MRAVGRPLTAETSSGRSLRSAARILLTVESYFRSVVEIVAALLIAAEIVILFAGVISLFSTAAVGMVRRTGFAAVSLAGEPRGGRCLPAQRAHAHDRVGGNDIVAYARFPRGHLDRCD